MTEHNNFPRNSSTSPFTANPNFHPSPETTERLNTAIEPNMTEAVTEAGGQFLPWNNPWNIISYEASRQVVSVVDLYIFPCIVSIGLPANVLNCIVFWRQGVRNRTTLCLLWLSVTDLCYLLCETASAAHSFLAVLDPVFAKEYEVKRLSYATGVTLAFLTTSGLVTAVVAVERCVCVSLPLKAQGLMTTTTTALLLLSLSLLPQLGFCLFPLTMKPASVVKEGSGVREWFLAPTQGEDREILFLLFQHVVDVFLQFVVPVVTSVVVVVSTLITVVRLRLASEWRQSATTTTTTDTTTSTKTPLNTSQLQQAALTKMLVLVSCVFIVCSSPGLALALWRRIDTQFGPGGKYSNMFYASHIIAYHGFTACNSSVNFFVYFRRSSRFRAELRVLFGCCRKLEENGAGDAISRSNGTLVTQS